MNGLREESCELIVCDWVGLHDSHLLLPCLGRYCEMLAATLYMMDARLGQ